MPKSIMLDEDEKYMREALRVAKDAPFPFWSVIVRDWKIIAEWRSWETNTCDPTAHAEVNAIREACRSLANKSLKWHTLYTTCEPCPMCFWAAWWSWLERIVYWMTLEDANEIYWDEILVWCNHLNKNWWNSIEILWWVLAHEMVNFQKSYVANKQR